MTTEKAYDRIEHLKFQHQMLSNMVEETFDPSKLKELKIRKLRVKDELTRLSKEYDYD